MSLWQFHTKFDSAPLFDIFLHRKRNVVIKHDHTQTAVAHDWLNQFSWNKYGHAAQVTTNVLIYIYINVVLSYQFVHRKISTLTFGTSHVYATRRKVSWLLYRTPYLHMYVFLLQSHCNCGTIWYINRQILRREENQDTYFWEKPCTCVHRTSMTNTYCCVYSVEILLMMDSGHVRNM
jgi:hypothetical protein